MVQVSSRALIGLPDPGIRAKLAKGIVPVLVHYTGVNGYNDPAKDWAYARSVATYGLSSGKTYEYNYLIGLGGSVFEQAGERVGAHCANFNTKSYGILFMNGILVAPTEAQIRAFHELREDLVATGQLSRDHVVVPHYRYRTTSCPGSKLSEAPGAAWASPTGQGRLGNLIPELIRNPYTPPTPPPTPPDPAPPVTPIPNPPLDSDLMITIWQGTDCMAQFIGVVDSNGNALDVRWIQGDPRHIAVRDAHIAAGARVIREPLTGQRFRNVVLNGPIPYGDTYNWTEDDFFLVRPDA